MLTHNIVTTTPNPTPNIQPSKNQASQRLNNHNNMLLPRDSRTNARRSGTSYAYVRIVLRSAPTLRTGRTAQKHIVYTPPATRHPFQQQRSFTSVDSRATPRFAHNFTPPAQARNRVSARLLAKGYGFCTGIYAQQQHDNGAYSS